MRTLLLLAAAFVLFLPAATFAQRHPPMTEQQRDIEKERYYANFNELRRIPLADNQRRAYEAAIEYLKRFEGDKDPDARTVRQFVNEYERGGIQAKLLSTYNTKDYARTFAMGQPMLERNPENFFVLSILTEAGFDSAQAGKPEFVEDALSYARRAIEQLESGKVTGAEPFKDVGTAHGYLNMVVGTLTRDKAPVEAARAFRKAAQSESFYCQDPIVYHRMGIAILKGEFAQLSEEYNDKYGSLQSSPAQQAMLERIQKLGLQAIDAYARAVALTDPARAQDTTQAQFSPVARNKILEQLTALYRSFNNNSEAGLNELIATVLSKPLP
ncbi:MAG TPA: hypothetical protein VJV03_12345 [Pyrinomonadaceae bacterium]|nr:hypothetical protein [Pyrinomonadaceae bacterium]